MHLPNGNPVQAHSAGEIYPYVLARDTIDGKPRWNVLGPNATAVINFHTYEGARHHAVEMLKLRALHHKHGLPF